MRAHDEEGHARPIPEGKDDSPDAVLDDEAARRDGMGSARVPQFSCQLRFAV
jgi:hypothetical protein